MLDGACILGNGREPRSRLCAWLERCMYVTQRDELDPQLLEVLDAWAQGRVCVLIYRPAAGSLER